MSFQHDNHAVSDRSSLSLSPPCAAAPTQRCTITTSTRITEDNLASSSSLKSLPVNDKIQPTEMETSNQLPSSAAYSSKFAVEKKMSGPPYHVRLPDSTMASIVEKSDESPNRVSATTNSNEVTPPTTVPHLSKIEPKLEIQDEKEIQEHHDLGQILNFDNLQEQQQESQKRSQMIPLKRDSQLEQVQKSQFDLLDEHYFSQSPLNSPNAETTPIDHIVLRGFEDFTSAPPSEEPKFEENLFHMEYWGNDSLLHAAERQAHNHHTLSFQPLAADHSSLSDIELPPISTNTVFDVTLLDPLEELGNLTQAD